jgi:hypothetical protein
MWYFKQLIQKTELDCCYCYNCKIIVGFKMKDHRSWFWRGFWEIGLHYYYNYIIKRQQHAEAVYTYLTVRRQYDVRKVKRKYSICIICVSFTNFPEASSVFGTIILNPTTILQLGVFPYMLNSWTAWIRILQNKELGAWIFFVRKIILKMWIGRPAVVQFSNRNTKIIFTDLMLLWFNCSIT